MKTKFQLNKVCRLVFDLNHLHSIFNDEGWTNFQTMIKVLDERSYSIVLISELIRIQDWQTYQNVSVLNGKTLDLLQQNINLDDPLVFWISDDPDIQTLLAQRNQGFA